MREREFAPERFSGPIASHAAELEVIGCALYAPDRCEDAFDRLGPNHFHEPVHSRVWSILSDLRTQRTAIEPTVIAHRLGSDSAFEEYGGLQWLLTLIEKASLPGLQANVDVVGDLHTRRAVERAAREAADRAKDTGDATGADILTDLERNTAEIAQATNMRTAWVAAGDMVAAAIEEVKNRKGVINFPTGIMNVDRVLGGLNAGETTTIGAWSGMGKTIAAVQIAKANGQQRKGVAYFSLEMHEVPMAMRMACDVLYDRSAAAYSGQTTNITIDRAIKGSLDPHEYERLYEAQRIIAGWPIFYDTRPGLSVAQIEAATRRLHRKWAQHGIEPGPVIIDHIGKVRPTKDRRGNVTAETRDIANDLDAMAKRMNVPVVILTQLNRKDQDGKEDKRPTLSSVKDSGALVENSRQVIFIYRPEYYHREPFEHETMEAKAERLEKLSKVENHFYWIIEKNSNGPTQQVLSYCKAACSAVRDWS